MGETRQESAQTLRDPKARYVASCHIQVRYLPRKRVISCATHRNRRKARQSLAVFKASTVYCSHPSTCSAPYCSFQAFSTLWLPPLVSYFLTSHENFRQVARIKLMHTGHACTGFPRQDGLYTSLITSLRLALRFKRARPTS